MLDVYADNLEPIKPKWNEFFFLGELSHISQKVARSGKIDPQLQGADILHKTCKEQIKKQGADIFHKLMMSRNQI